MTEKQVSQANQEAFLILRQHRVDDKNAPQFIKALIEFVDNNLAMPEIDEPSRKDPASDNHLVATSEPVSRCGSRLRMKSPTVCSNYSTVTYHPSEKPSVMIINKMADRAKQRPKSAFKIGKSRNK